MYNVRVINKRLLAIDLELDNLDHVMRSYEISDETYQNKQYRQLDREYNKLMTRRKFWFDKLKGQENE